MKLRIKSNSLRYRLTQTDVSTLAKSGYLKETVNFGDDELVYVLQSIADNEISADFKNNIVTMYIPKTMVDELVNTNRVGFENTKGKLQLLIEKDFTCLDNVEEDQSDNYPNPLAQKS
jgi:predicted nucleotidyltransferase